MNESDKLIMEDMSYIEDIECEARSFYILLKGRETMRIHLCEQRDIAQKEKAMALIKKIEAEDSGNNSEEYSNACRYSSFVQQALDDVDNQIKEFEASYRHYSGLLRNERAQQLKAVEYEKSLFGRVKKWVRKKLAS